MLHSGSSIGTAIGWLVKRPPSQMSDVLRRLVNCRCRRRQRGISQTNPTAHAARWLEFRPGTNRNARLTFLFLLRRVGVIAGGASAISAAYGQGSGRPLPTGRIIGVFDEETGVPISGAQVRDLGTGKWALTTSTGTVDLFFADTSTVLIRITRLGYSPLTLPVENTRRDTIPITITLRALGQRLDPMITTAMARRGPADTVRKLEVMGFYDRQQASGAPASAFVTSERIEKLTLLSDLARITGHAICPENLYLDGIKIEVPQLRSSSQSGLRGNAVVAPPLKDGLDALLSVHDVLAVELYDVATTPAQFNKTRSARSRICGTTLIWTK